MRGVRILRALERATSWNSRGQVCSSLALARTVYACNVVRLVDGEGCFDECDIRDTLYGARDVRMSAASLLRTNQ